ncbi:MAG: hypothetical protein JW798_00845 [Prolixibacteraceae bacterium]|nr:hypothetical protein [Prolixibacteraceae bacterium]
MSWLSQQYKNNLNGIIFTLVFHIVVFAALNIAQFRIKKEYHEPEILIEFPLDMIEPPVKPVDEELQQEAPSTAAFRTNIASNRSAPRMNEVFNESYRDELERAQQLANDVSQQLSKEIPTVNDLQMPVETSEGIDIDSLKMKLYSGDSNVEYSLADRYHVRLPIPVYLAENGGKVKVMIDVDRRGEVIKADPVVEPYLTDQILSYAKTAALRTRFNSSEEAPAVQKGYIQYTFVAQ